LTTCVNTSTWWPTGCGGTGQDGAFGRDVTHPNDYGGPAGFSFVKVCNNGNQTGQFGCEKTAVQGSGPHDWGCTKDRVTGLTWELRTSDGSIRDANRIFTNFGTNDPSDTGGLVAAMNAQALCGATDWRLPSVTELFTLANYSLFPDMSTWIPDVAFGFNAFWTSEALQGSADDAWYVDWTMSAPGGPENYFNFRSGFDRATAARVVRGSVNLTLLEPNGGEVADAVNHLSWRRCVEGMTWHEPNCVGTPTLLFWSDALAYAKEVAATTGVAWRLPNIKELQSIVVLSTTPTIDHSLFPQTPETWAWSSTGWDRYQIFNVDFLRGRASHESGVNESNFAIRLVRDTD
jgi:hypothetical protein